jgi:hypothetical protein
MTHRLARTRLQVEFLEAREVPDATPIIETFDTTTPPGLPSGWTKWTSDGSSGFGTATGTGLGGSVALVSSGGSATASLAWTGDPLPGDTGAALSVQANSLVPMFVFARGSGLGTSTPSYLAAVVTRGLSVQLVQVTNGTASVLGSVTSPTSAYLSGQWVRVSLVPTGSSVAVQVTRADTGQFLNANGNWQAAQTSVITATTTLTPATGRVGVGRVNRYAGLTTLDNFTILPVDVGVQESFDTTAVGAIPAGWQSWVAGAPGGFGATTANAVSPANGFASTGGSSTVGRAWANTDLPADVDASAAVYLDGLIPARVFARGANLNTATPTYYAASITRGLTVKLVRVVNGVETGLGSVTSDEYVSAEWVRLRLTAEGNRLRVTVYRPSTGQWLTPDGTWSDSPDFALELNDTAISAGGKAGLARSSVYSGAVLFDDFDAHAASANVGPVVTVAPTSGSSPFSGEVTFHATATGNPTRIEFRLNNVLRSVSPGTPADWTLDTTTLTNGTYTLVVRAFDAAGNVGTTEYAFTTSNADAGPIPTPTIPRHYTHIRIAELAYSGNPMGTFEQNLLQNSVDLVIPNVRYLGTINSVSPNTPQLIYTNVSNLYQGLLTDWLRYADSKGVSRELAFYHVTKATAFSGASPSSQPVNWFWGTYQTLPGGTTTDVTSAARGGRTTNVTFGATGTTTAIGYTDKFREMNVTLVRGAAAGWSGVWEYASAVDSTGKPTAWKTLTLNSDATNGLTQTGRITFDPPADWVAASIGGSARLYYVRLRVTAGTDSQGPELQTVFGRDYVGANGTFAGTIPAFDYAADANHDGYLTDGEYANRKAGLNARFEYESRLFYPFYGQMRFVTNPSSSAVRHWAADYHVRLLQSTPLADGVFIDNATGKLPFPGVSVLEPTATFGIDSGALVAAVSRAIDPHWVLANTAGGGFTATPVSAGAAASFEEFLIRAMQANWSEVGDAVNLVNERLNNGSEYLVIDSHPAGGSTTDARTQLATLAYYYLLADPDRTFLMFFGGYNPASSWTEHWSPAAAVDIGTPAGDMRQLAAGLDPANSALTYKVFARDYTNGLVVYKPLSYATGQTEGTTANNTTTTHQLGGTYRQVQANGTLGPVVTAVALRNGEGAVFVKA